MSPAAVLVVGAGPVGLTLAAELARRGVPSRIIDQSVGPSTTSKAIAIRPRTLEIFRQMGVIDEVLSRGFMVGAGNFYCNGRLLSRLDFHELDSPYRFIVDLPQNETEQVLLEHLARYGLAVERETRLLKIEQDEEGVTVEAARTTGAETFRCSYVVGCDGAYSTVRHGLGLGFTAAATPELLALADAEIDWMYQHELHVFMHSDGVLVCFPLPGGRFRLIADVTSEELACEGGNDRPLKATPERLREIMRRRADAEAKITDISWLAGFRIRRQIVERYGEGRVFLAGDAAHVPSPAGGQGMNTGIQDVCNLAWKIHLAVGGRAAAGLLDSYDAERAPVGRKVVALPDLAAHSTAADLPTMLQQIGEIGIHYRNSPIVAEDWSSAAGGPQPGDHAPFVTGLDGGAHHLLLFAGNEKDLPVLDRVRRLAPEGLVLPWLVTPKAVEWNGPVLLDENGLLQRSFGVESACVYLIRPDGYVGYRGAPVDAGLMSAYLGRIFG